MNYRPLRVGKLIKQELSKIILREIEFPGSLVTITDVEVDKKLENAKVMVSILPSSSAKEIFEKLKRGAGKLQHLLLKKINIKPMPRISFQIDHGPENAAHVEKLLMGNK